MASFICYVLAFALFIAAVMNSGSMICLYLGIGAIFALYSASALRHMKAEEKRKEQKEEAEFIAKMEKWADANSQKRNE